MAARQKRFLSVTVFVPAEIVGSYMTGAGAAEAFGWPVEIRGGILAGEVNFNRRVRGDRGEEF
jgi:hypothetical protein